MRTLIAAAFVAVACGPACASGWTAYYDCGNGVVPIFGGWHGKTWISGVEADHKTIFGTDDPSQIEIFQDLGVDVREGEEPTSLNADKTVFDFKVEWHGKTVILRWNISNDGPEVTFDGHVCRDMGDGRYDDTEAGRYVKQGVRK
jgi:hypothetical protein